MAKKKEEVVATQNTEVDDISSQLIKDLNKEMGVTCAYDLSLGAAPTIVKRWIGTGSLQLDHLIRNAEGGGYPEGRVIEIAALPSLGKSHLAYHAAATAQAMGGIVVLIDTENATPLDKLQSMGIDVKKRFVYVDTHVIEDVFTITESIIAKTKQIAVSKNKPVLIIWDSMAATSPKAEIEGTYDQNTVGLAARVVSKAMRKIVGVIGQNNITFLCLNQLRMKIGVMGHADPYVTPMGIAVPFHASVRVRLSSGSPIKNERGDVIGIHVTATTKKNKVGPPLRKCEFDIVFGRGIVEHEYIFDELRSYCDREDCIKNGKKIKISGTGSWKELVVNDITTGEVIVNEKFYKKDFDTIMNDPIMGPYVMQVFDAAYTLDIGQHKGIVMSTEEVSPEETFEE